jgi:hypothetical protein
MGPKAGGRSDRRGYDCDRLREPQGVESAMQPAWYVLGQTLQFIFDIYRNIYRRVYKIMGPLLIWAHGHRTRSHRLRSGPAWQIWMVLGTTVFAELTIMRHDLVGTFNSWLCLDSSLGHTCRPCHAQPLGPRRAEIDAIVTTNSS